MAQEQLTKVFLDLDGTLLDVSERNHRVYSELVREFGGTALSKPAYWELKRQKAKWPELLPKSGLSPHLEKEFLDRFIARIETPAYLRIDTLFDDALLALHDLARFRCILVSLRRNHPNLLEQLQWLGIHQHLHKVLTGHSKSDGYDKKIELIKGELGDGRGIIIGDTEADIVTGKELGLITVAVTSGIRDEQFLSALEPDYLVTGIGEAAKLPTFSQKQSFLGGI